MRLSNALCVKHLGYRFAAYSATQFPLPTARVALHCLSARHLLSVCQVTRVTSQIPFRSLQTQLLCLCGNHCFVWHVFLFPLVNHETNILSSFLSARVCVCVSFCIWHTSLVNSGYNRLHTWSLPLFICLFTSESFPAVETRGGWTGSKEFRYRPVSNVVIVINRLFTSQPVIPRGWTALRILRVSVCSSIHCSALAQGYIFPWVIVGWMWGSRASSDHRTNDIIPTSS